MISTTWTLKTARGHANDFLIKLSVSAKFLRPIAQAGCTAQNLAKLTECFTKRVLFAT